MKIFLTVGLVFVLGSACVYAEEFTDAKVYKEVTILEKGVKRKQKIAVEPKAQEASDAKATSREASKSKDEGIVVMFKQRKRRDVQAFAQRYGLKLRKRLLSGYYLFDNLSESTDEEVVANIIENEKDVQTVKLNRKKRNKMR